MNPYILTSLERDVKDSIDYLAQWERQFKILANTLLALLTVLTLLILGYHYI